MVRKIDRTGEEGFNSFGSKMIIVEYINNKHIDVYFPSPKYPTPHCLGSYGQLTPPFLKLLYVLFLVVQLYSGI